MQGLIRKINDYRPHTHGQSRISIYFVEVSMARKTGAAGGMVETIPQVDATCGSVLLQTCNCYWTPPRHDDYLQVLARSFDSAGILYLRE
jgi:hypothetical protein